MNKDIRIAVSFKGHRKRKKLNLLLKREAVGFLLDLWISTAMDKPKGVLDGMDELDIALAAGWDDDPDEFCRAMVGAGFLEINDNGEYSLHDWEEHQEYASKAPERSEKAKKAAEARWRGKEESLQENATSIVEQCYGHSSSTAPSIDLDATSIDLDARSNAPSPSPSPSPEPEPEPEPKDKGQKQKTSPGLSPATPSSPPPALIQPEEISCQAIVDVYHEVLPELPRVRILTDARRKAIRSRLRSDADRRDLEWWRRYFLAVRPCRFLFGANNRNWTASFDFLISQKGMAGVLEGKYADRKGATATPAGSIAAYVDAMFPDEPDVLDAEVIGGDG